MNKYTAQIHYNRQNIMKMADIVCYANTSVSPAIIRFSGIALVFAGLYRTINGGDGAMAIIIAGVLIITNADVRGRSLGRKMCKFMEDWWPVMKFTFDDSAILSETDREKSTTRYKDVTRLVENRGFFYIFTGDATAFMIDSSTVSPNELDAFRVFIMRKTKLQWTAPGKTNLSVQAIIMKRRNKKLLDQ